MRANIFLCVLLGLACGREEGHEPRCYFEIHPYSNPIFRGGGAHLSANSTSDGLPCIAFANQNGDVLLSCEKNGQFESLEVGGKVNPAWFGRSIGLALMGQERYVFFWDSVEDNLKVAYDTDMGFSIETVDSGEKCGVDLSVAVHANEFHVAYLDMGEHDLKYAKGRPGSFEIATLDSSGAVGNDPSVAVDQNGEVHICYYGCGEFSLSGCEGELRYIVVGAPPQIVDHGNDAGWYCSIALDRTSSPHIVYHVHKNGELRYAFQDSDKKWHVKVIDSGPGAGAFAVVVLQGQSPIIAYSKEGINGVVLVQHQGNDTFVRRSLEIGTTPAKYITVARLDRCRSFLGWFDQGTDVVQAVILAHP